MGIQNDKFFFLMKLADGYAVLDESFTPTIIGGANVDELIEYLKHAGANREDIIFVNDDDFEDIKSKILCALPLSIIS